MMKSSVTTRFLRIAAFTLLVSAPALASDTDLPITPGVAELSAATLNIPPQPARMAPELALQVHDARTKRQARELGAYRDNTIVEAELPQTRQKGRYQLQRMYSAPKSLAFKAINFVGDGFVKTNVIARLLQSEVERAKQGDNSDVAITAENYKFTYKGVAEMENGPLCHVFQVKPRKKRVGLFKGTIYLNVYTGGMYKAEGKMVKSPSFFVKNIEFSQEYTQVGGFDIVTHIRSTADTRIVGKAIVDITHTDVQAQTIYELQATSPQPQPQTPSVRTVSLNSDR